MVVGTAPALSLDSHSRSERRLSQVAKRLAIPRDIVGTDWGPVRDTCRDALGIEFDTWQDGMGQLLLSRNSEGLFSHTVGGFGLSAMRQVGKTYFFAGAFFGMCQRYPGLLVVWSAQHSRTHEETFEAMQGLAARIKIAPLIEWIHTGSGTEEIRFFNGSRIMFGARERGFPRGVPDVDVLMNDEGQILSQRAMQNMLATMNTSQIGLHIYAGTPPKPEDNSERWMTMRDEAWAIEDRNIVTTHTDDLVWIEIGGNDDLDIHDPAQFFCNPSYPHRTPIQAFHRLRKGLNVDGWRREGLGLYDQDTGSVFNMAQWGALSLEDADEPQRAALVLDISPDRRWSCIGIATELDEDRDFVMVKSMQGTRGVVAEIVKLYEDKDLIDIAITPGAARALETELSKANIPYEIMAANEVGAAYGDLQERIKNGRVAHLNQPELNFALGNCKTRFLQTGESESFDRRADKAPGVDISPAVAAAAALYRWGLNNEPMPLFL